MRPPSPRRDPLERLALTWRQDAGLDAELREHLLSVGAQARRQVQGFTVLQRLAVVEVLMLYRAALEKPIDALTMARVVSQTMVALRGLGLALSGPFERGRGVPRRKVPTAARRGGEDEGEDDSGGEDEGEAADAS
jgi:hypothetical protein